MSLIFEEKPVSNPRLELLSDRQVLERAAIARAALLMAENEKEETEAELLAERQKVDELMRELNIKNIELSRLRPPWWVRLWRWIWKEV